MRSDERTSGRAAAIDSSTSRTLRLPVDNQDWQPAEASDIPRFWMPRDGLLEGRLVAVDPGVACPNRGSHKYNINYGIGASGRTLSEAAQIGAVEGRILSDDVVLDSRITVL